MIVLALNYAVIGFPVIRKSASLNDKATTMLMKQIKSGKSLRSASEDEYILEIFRREKKTVDGKILILNCVAISLAVLIASWTVFGLLVHRRG